MALSIGAQWLLMVADGMGGYLAGDVASRQTVDYFNEHLRDAAAVTVNDLVAMAKAASNQIYEMGRGNPEYEGMGTTLTLALVDDHHAYLVHAGDSRAYLWRRGMLSRLTDDHSIAGELLRQGKINEEQARVHPQRHVVTRGLGGPEIPDFDTRTVELESGDLLLLCSDGLYATMPDAHIADILGRGLSPALAAEDLVNAANIAGGPDNITVVLAELRGETK
jgi:protein phosphatase